MPLLACRWKNRHQRSKLTAQLCGTDRRLQALLAVPIFTAEDMCPDCCTPQFQLGFGDVQEMRPCPSWPTHAARVARVWELLRSSSDRVQHNAPEPSKLHPLAVLPGGPPIAEVIEKLAALQKEHPEAIVKRGRANRWELWAKD